ncbi:MAG TPA: EFR1 family ferrodoxin [Bacillota bacterium]
MKTKIYYFSATGNSFQVAKKIAAGIGEAELISIPQKLKASIDTSGAKIGLVFPVYAWGMPRIVSDFLKKLTLHKEQYIFAVATNAGTPGGTLKQLEKRLRRKGAHLNAGFAVREANFTALSGNLLITLMSRLNKTMPEPSSERLQEIIETIKHNRNHPPETSSRGANFVGNLFHGLALWAFQTQDRNFRVKEQCNNCRICERVCPRSNIKIEHAKPTWNHHCELCFACLQWCPQSAIQYQNGTTGERKASHLRHHPEVRLDDLLLR